MDKDDWSFNFLKQFLNLPYPAAEKRVSLQGHVLCSLNVENSACSSFKVSNINQIKKIKKKNKKA